MNEFVARGHRRIPVRRKRPVIIKSSPMASGRIAAQRPVNPVFQNMRTRDIHTHTLARAGVPENHFAVRPFGIHAQDDPGIEIYGAHPGDLGRKTIKFHLAGFHNHASERPGVRRRESQALEHE